MVIKMDLPRVFKTNQTYKFYHSTNKSEFFEAKYLVNSRIDNFPIFMIKSTFNHPIAEYNYSGVSPKSVDLVTSMFNSTIEDNFAVNKHNILCYFLEKYKIDISDLEDESKCKSIIRNLKLNDLLG